ncbi:hypothetical protein BDV27DRAFT_160707 [Aspergillus caelatus]|uniref:Uncharacterized protein n=1 Tax=Aspergillus caelatus TaxID=61420 RepID=A0A5N6ZV24_9EURO|nr:uncharacterized protein BDV27DRAFT_160707 [Aspergillus caelatus]KAE8361464.1 hypothetical protein BDV27DRAFT_160707 [Aspergillus caelatus]
METAASSTPKARSHWVQKLYNALGFKKGYNFILFFIFGGAWMGFTLARLEFLDFSTFCKNAVPGECFYYKGRGYIGLYLHLGCILPAAFLAFFQFIPAIRYRVILFHRINGYIIILLVLLSNAGALMIARHSFGGLLSTQAAVGFLVILSTCAIGMAYYNVKRLQLEQHRAWMLRAFFYMGCIITVRIILVISTTIISISPKYYMAQPCGKIDFMIGKERTLESYPDCASFYNGSHPDQNVLVLGDFNGDADRIGTALNMNFGMAFWLALFLHFIGVEIYLQLTPRESQRLREISYTRQLEAGFENPGRAGLTVDRFGDSQPWVSGK